MSNDSTGSLGNSSCAGKDAARKIPSENATNRIITGDYHEQSAAGYSLVSENYRRRKCERGAGLSRDSYLEWHSTIGKKLARAPKRRSRLPARFACPIC